MPEEQLERVAELVGAFVRCLAPGGTPEQIAEGKRAAGELLELLRGLLGRQEGPVAELARRLPGEDKAVLANAIGFLTQAYEATAGLIASSALAMMEKPGNRGGRGGGDRPSSSRRCRVRGVSPERPSASAAK